jgi:hypothetical protein
MNPFKSLLLASLVALAVTAATAATAAPRGNFEAMDVNRDGAVTRGEIRAYKNAKRAAKGLPVKP